MSDSEKVWYTQVGWTSWVAYKGRKAIWEATEKVELERWLRQNGHTDAEWRPMGRLYVR